MLRWRLTFLCIGFGGLLALYTALAPTKRAGARIAAPAPAFLLAAAAGGLVSLSEQKGQVVFLDFWATWCDTCKAAMPAVEALHLRHRAQGLKVLAVSLDTDGRKAVLPFAARHGLSFTILLSDEKVIQDYLVRGLPTAYLIDRSGVIVQRYTGPVDDHALENDILKELQRRN